MLKSRWGAALAFFCVFAAGLAMATTPAPRDPPPAETGPTRITSPLASDPVRSWQDATRNRQTSTGAEATIGPRTQPPPSGRSGAANTRVTFPNCQDPSAANFGSLGNCIHLPPPPPTCQDPAALNFGGPLPCVFPPPPPGCAGPNTDTITVTNACPAPSTGTYRQTLIRERECNAGAWEDWRVVGFGTNTRATDCVAPPPATCQDPTAINFGGPLPCIPPPICDTAPGTADCCLPNPGHPSCPRFNCENTGGHWMIPRPGSPNGDCCSVPLSQDPHGGLHCIECDPFFWDWRGQWTWICS